MQKTNENFKAKNSSKKNTIILGDYVIDPIEVWHWRKRGNLLPPKNDTIGHNKSDNTPS